METILTPERSSSASQEFPHDEEVVSRIVSSVEFPSIVAGEDSPEAGTIDIATLSDVGRLPANDQRLLIEKELQLVTDGLVRSAWWNSQLVRDIYGRQADRVETEPLEPLTISRAHEFFAEGDGGPGVKYQVIEVGQQDEHQLTEAELAAISSTLSHIDQFSGGAIGRNPNARRILAYNDDGLGVNGFARSSGTVLNIPGIRSRAIEEGVEPEVLLSVVLAHEVLGHQVDRMSNGETREFIDHFRYEGATQYVGDHDRTYNSHASVVPLAEDVGDSKTVRDYGGVSGAEDLATTAESIITRTLELSDKMKPSVKYTTTPDAHRDELMLDLFDRVARSVEQRTDAEAGGFIGVGSPLRRHETEEGVSYVDGRRLERRTLDSQEFIEQEIGEITNQLVAELSGKKVRFVPAGIDDFN